MQDVRLDEVDHRILEALREDGRISVNALARRVNVSRATAYQRLARLRDGGVIRRFRAEVDPRRMGLPIAALVMVSVAQHEWRLVAEKLRRLPGVEWLALTTGEFDFVVLVRAPDMEHLRDVVLGGFQSMPEVRTTETLMILDEPEPLAAAGTARSGGAFGTGPGTAGGVTPGGFAPTLPGRAGRAGRSGARPRGAAPR